MALSAQNFGARSIWDHVDGKKRTKLHPMRWTVSQHWFAVQ